VVMFGLFLLIAMAGLDNELLFAILLVLMLIVGWFYGALMETYWNGQTIGKRMVGIRVLSSDGQPINGLQGVMRNILREADLMPVIPFAAFGGAGLGGIPTGLIGLLVPVFTQRYQRLGDIVAGTIVIVEERSWTPATIKLDDPRIPQLAALLPVSLQFGHKMTQAIGSFMERRKFLSPGRRHEIARHIAKPLLERCNLPDDTSYDLFMCALYYRQFVAEGIDTDLRPTELQSPAIESNQPA